LIGWAGTVLAGFLAAASGLQLLLTPAARVDYERAVERARYRFVLGATKPFDEVYPRSVFEKRVRRELAQERILQRVFGLTVTPKLLSEEFDRVEKTSKAPEQWEAVKEALHKDRRLVEEVFCRPLLVERALRARFAFDQKIHARPHQKAREARAAFLGGGKVPGAAVRVLSRKSEAAPSVEEMLEKSKEEASLPRVIQPPRETLKDAPLPVAVDPETAAVLEKELRKPGDVTTILEERDRFEVFRLISAAGETWKIEAVSFPKVGFDTWFEKTARIR
jgi:hypothetical protein